MSERYHPPERPTAPEQRRSGEPRKARTWDTIRRRVTDDIKLGRGERSKCPVQESFSCYEGLTWDALSGYLVTKWPQLKGKLVERKELDVWIFEVPEPLTKTDRDNIASLRDSNTAQQPERRPSFSDED